MKRLLKLSIGFLVAYLLYRLLVEYLRPTRVRLDEQLSTVSSYREPPLPSMPSRLRPSRPPGEPHRLDLNQADATSLIALPGIGPALAERIIAHREQLGPFASLDDLTQVSGIGSALVERLHNMVTLY